MRRFYKLSLWLMLFMVVSHAAWAQVTVRGTVTDGNGETLVGVTVQVKNRTNGVITDIDGNYSINVPATPATLIFNYVGFVPDEYEVTSSTTTIDVTMVEDIINLNEVVITGLGTSVKRANLANAISTVSAKELTGTTSQQTVDGALYGKLTGVNIVQSSGAPGGGMAVRLRGISSINGQNQPLYIVDGVFVSNAETRNGLRFASGANRESEENSSNRIADLDPADIENIEVLKGPSAAAIYGTRANAGVIIITTKRGSSGKTNIRFSQDLGFNTIIKKVGVRQFTEETVRETYGDDEVDLFVAARNAGRIYDYEEELYGEEGFITNTNLSITGGNDKTKFYISGSLRDEDGIIDRTGYARRSIRTNIDHRISNVFSISTSTNFINTVGRQKLYR